MSVCEAHMRLTNTQKHKWKIKDITQKAGLEGFFFFFNTSYQ